MGNLLTLHESFALITVALAVSLLLVRYMAADGFGGGSALLYLAATLVLLAVVALTGYYGGELDVPPGHRRRVAQRSRDPDGVYGANVPVKPMTALIGLHRRRILGGWLLAGGNSPRVLRALDSAAPTPFGARRNEARPRGSGWSGDSSWARFSAITYLRVPTGLLTTMGMHDNLNCAPKLGHLQSPMLGDNDWV